MKFDIKRQWRSWMWSAQRFGISPDKLPARLSPRDVKVFCSSIPKSGTHILERVLCLHPHLYRKAVRTLHAGNLEDYGGLARLLDSLRKGQILVSHLPPRESVVRELEARGIKRIFMIRDPRDVVISRMFYALTNKKHICHYAYASKKSLKERIMLGIQGDVNYGIPSVNVLYDCFAGWLENGVALGVRFEDLVGPKGGGDHETQVNTVKKIFHYLGIPLSESEYMMIVQNAFSDVSPTFRKGKANGWKDCFDVDTAAAFKEIAKETLIRYGYEKDDCW